jgi:hypothetical protein
MADDFERASFVPPTSEHSDTADESTAERDATPHPAKKLKAEPKKAVAKTAAKKKAVSKKADKKKVDDESDVEIVNSNAEPPQEPPQEPKPKKVKPRMRDEINIAAKKIEENESQGSKYANMVKSMSGNRGEEPEALKGTSRPQATVVGGKKLQREGAIADIRTFGMEITATEPDQASKYSKQNNPAVPT